MHNHILNALNSFVKKFKLTPYYPTIKTYIDLGGVFLGSMAVYLGPTFMTKKHINNPSASEKDGQAYVYIWLPSNGCIGHSSMYFFKEGDDNSQHYVSFWPTDDAFKAMNALPPFTKFLGLGAKFAPDLNYDIKEEQTEPDQIIKIHNLDYEKMDASFNKLKKDVIHGKLEYTLFFNTPVTINEIFIKIVYRCPFTGLSLLDNENEQSVIQRHVNKTSLNCTSAVEKVLYPGGFSIPLRLMLWGRIPMAQGFDLRKLGADPVTTEEEFNNAIEKAKNIRKK